MSETGYLNVAEIFGENVFNDAVMLERLPKKVYKKLKEVINEGKELDLDRGRIIRCAGHKGRGGQRKRHFGGFGFAFLQRHR